jgi:hypothetical protein
MSTFESWIIASIKKIDVLISRNARRNSWQQMFELKFIKAKASGTHDMEAKQGHNEDEQYIGNGNHSKPQVKDPGVTSHQWCFFGEVI